MDNGSTDDSPAFLSTLTDPRIKVIHLPENLGVSAGRNAALAEAAGSFICFLDGDDILPKRSLSSRIEKFEMDDDIQFVDGVVKSFAEETSSIIDSYTPNPSGSLLQSLLSLDGSVFMGNSWMIKRVEGKKYAFDSSISHGEELLLYASIADSGKYAFTDETILYYRRRSDSAMANLTGLTQGYVSVYKRLKQLNSIPDDTLQRFKAKARSIMFRSHLKRLQPFRALNAYIQLTMA